MPGPTLNTNSLVSQVWSLFSENAEELAAQELATDEGDPATRALGYIRQGNALMARVAAKEAVAAAMRSGSSRTICQAMIAEAEALILEGEFSQADHAIDLVEAAVDRDDLAARPLCLEVRGWWLARVGTFGSRHYEDARRTFDEAEAAYRESRSWSGVVRSLEGRAWAEAGSGNYTLALESIAVAGELCLRHRLGDFMHRLALLTALIGKDAGYEEFGLHAFPRVLQWCTTAGDGASMARAMIGYASVFAHRSEQDPVRACQAQGLLRQATDLTVRLGLRGLELEARSALIALLRRAHDPEGAELERVQIEGMAEHLSHRQVLELLYREREQQTLFNGKLRRQVARLQATLESSVDAILVFDPRPGPDGSIGDFSCETANGAATRLLHPDGNGVLTLSEVTTHPLLDGVERLLVDCWEKGAALQDEVRAAFGREVRHYVRRAVPALPGVALCLRDVTERVRWEKQLEAAMEKALEKSRALRRQQRDLLEANRRLDKLAMTDGLTGLLNHRAFQERLDEELHRANRERAPLSLIMLDVDHFKLFNDDHGHQEGDRVLRQVAGALSEARGREAVARYGGEEFAVIMPGTDAETAVSLADRMRARINSLGSERCTVTASFGVASLGPDVVTKEDLIAAADQALFASKQNGRNRVTHHTTLQARAA